MRKKISFLFGKFQILLRTGFLDIFGSSVINKIITFMSNVVLVRILSKKEYGTFTYVWNIYNIIMLTRGLGIDSGYLQLSSEKNPDKKHKKSLLAFSVRVGNYFNFFLAFILLGIGFIVPLKIGKASNLLKMTFLLPVIQYIFSLLCISFRAEKKNKKYACLTNFNTLMIALCSVIGAYIFKESGLIIGYYLAYILSILFALKIQHANLLFKGKITHNEKKEILSISIVGMCNTGLSQLLYLLDVFILGLVMTNENILADYKIATQIPSALIFIPSSVVIYLYPYFAEHREDGSWCLKKYRNLICLFGSFNLFLSFFLVLFSPWIIRLVYGTKYLDAVPIFRILSINYFFSATFRIVSGNLLVTQRKLKFNFIVSFITGLINIIGDVIMIPRYTSIGAAIVTLSVVLISGFMTTAFLIYIFKRKVINENQTYV